MASFNDIRRDEARLPLPRYVSEHPEASTRDIARAIGLSKGAAFYLLTALMEKGLVKARNFAASNRKSNIRLCVNAFRSYLACKSDARILGTKAARVCGVAREDFFDGE